MIYWVGTQQHIQWAVRVHDRARAEVLVMWSRWAQQHIQWTVRVHDRARAEVLVMWSRWARGRGWRLIWEPRVARLVQAVRCLLWRQRGRYSCCHEPCSSAAVWYRPDRPLHSWSVGTVSYYIISIVSADSLTVCCEAINTGCVATDCLFAGIEHWERWQNSVGIQRGGKIQLALREMAKFSWHSERWQN